MPNWVKNKIMVGNSRIIEEFKTKYGTKDENGEINLDFEKVIPMPKELNIEYGSRSSDGLSLYLTKMNPNCNYFGSAEDKASKDEFEIAKKQCELHSVTYEEMLSEEDVHRLTEKYKDKDLDYVLDLGKKCLENAGKYGAMNWYEWSVKNWGTKWNSCSTTFDEKSISFDTAWDPALPIVQKMSEQNPDVPMAILYADEEIGCHTGYMLIKNGHIDFEGSFPDQSVDAFKEAFDLWGCADEFEFDEAHNTYHRIDSMAMCAA